MNQYRLLWLTDYLAWLETYRPDDTVRIREVKEMIKREGG